MSPTAGPGVLLVEDNDTERQTMRELLEDDGFLVVGEAADGEEAIQLADQLCLDVVLMDLRMPRVGGMEASRRIKNALPTTQIIILTAYEDSFLTRSAEQVGAYAYLVKGSTPKLVREIVRQAWAFAVGVRQQRPSVSAQDSPSGPDAPIGSWVNHP